MKKLLLVNPRGYDLSNFTGGRWGMLPVTLPTVTALTPDAFEVRIVDEYVGDKVDFDAPVDLVGITVLPPQCARARRVAEEFRRRGVPVAVGGPFPSLSPQRCRDFADVLFIGRAERTWPRFCADFLAGRYEKEYADPEQVDFSRVPLADYRGFSRETLEGYSAAVVHVGSGCVHGCDFCDAVVYSGTGISTRSAESTIREVDALYQLGIRTVFLASDNLLVKRDETKATLRRLAEWQRAQPDAMAFIANIDISVAGDVEFLELSARAGLVTYLVGLESPNRESLDGIGKNVNLKHDTRSAVRRIFEHGINVYGYLMVGFDEDDLSIFRKQVEFQQQLGLGWANLNVVDARDGTELKERMIREGRYVDFSIGGYGRPWGEVRPNNINLCTIVPKNMTVRQLQQGAYWTLTQMCDWGKYMERVKVFFDTFEASPKRDSLGIPAQTPPAEMPGPIRDFLATASPRELEAFEFTASLAMGSSHPQAVSIAMRGFMPTLGLSRMLAQQVPNIDDVSYPV